MPIRKSRRLAVIGAYQANLQGRNLTYTLKQSQRIRGIRLEIRSGSGLTVVVPGHYKPGQVQQMLDEKALWILKHLPTARPQQMPLFSKEIDHGEKVPYLGREVKLVISADHHKIACAELKDESLFLYMRAGQKSVARVLEKWYRRQAELIFTQKADKFSAMMGLRYNKIIIRGQKTRWGSCSHTGNLALNWKLMLAPEAIIDYVIVHELAHIKHMNHSHKFWEFVGLFCPEWRKYRQWLGKHEEYLKTTATFGLA